MADGGGVIDNLTIQNFRLFESLEVKGIKRVNLIVGRNNAGKSALLEALQLYFSGFSPFVMYQLLTERQEVYAQSLNDMSLESKSPLRHLFSNHSIPFNHQKNIFISSNNAHSFNLGYEQGKVRTLSQLMKGYSLELSLRHQLGGELVSNENIPLFSLLEYISSPKLLTTNNAIVRKLSTKGLSDNSALRLWDSISLTSAQDDVIKAFHIIEPCITGLSFVAADNESNNRIPIVKLKDMSEPIPLKSLGDGMTRLFHIILSLVTAKDGVLLIDEFENGLHWSTQTKAWELIFILAKQWNVQVFCTTHSKDCINSFEGIWTQNPEDAAFFRLYRKENQSHIKAYDLEMLSDAIETETEVR